MACTWTPTLWKTAICSVAGLGKVFDFAFTLAARLQGDEAPAREQAEHIYYPW